MLITALLHFQLEGRREPRNEVGCLSAAECLVDFEATIFRFLRRLNPLGHFLQRILADLYFCYVKKNANYTYLPSKQGI